MQKYRPDLTAGMSRDQILALRNDPALSKEMVAKYADENKGILGSAGVPVNDGTAYLAHFAGPQGAISVLRADPNAPVGGILGEKVVAANPFLANMTAGDLVGWAGKKMGQQAPAPQQIPAPQMPQAMPQTPQAPMPQAMPVSQTPSQAPRQGILPAQEPPELTDLASLLQSQFKQLAPKRGLLNLRA